MESQRHRAAEPWPVHEKQVKNTQEPGWKGILGQIEMVALTLRLDRTLLDQMQEAEQRMEKMAHLVCKDDLIITIESRRGKKSPPAGAKAMPRRTPGAMSR